MSHKFQTNAKQSGMQKTTIYDKKDTCEQIYIYLSKFDWLQLDANHC